MWVGVWDRAEGHLWLESVPRREQKLNLAQVFSADEWELKALQEFIVYKKRCLDRIQNVEVNFQAIE